MVPWYASELVYSKASYPSLASHVERVQASGLPGATFDKPLTRTTDPTIVKKNHDSACGDAPSVWLMSCDEYPIATPGMDCPLAAQGAPLMGVRCPTSPPELARQA